MKTYTARWHRASPTTQVLRETAKNGGAVLAAIKTVSHTCYHWSAAGRVGCARSEYAAQRAARKAMREGNDDEE